MCRGNTLPMVAFLYGSGISIPATDIVRTASAIVPLKKTLDQSKVFGVKDTTSMA
jgi:hypothetical protein